MPNQPIYHRLQCHADPSDPLGLGRTGQDHLVAGGNLFQPIQRQMIDKFLIMIQVNKPTAAMPPSITAGGIGAAVMVSHLRQAYCGRM